MTKLPTDDDQSLVNFLKANRPEVPPADPNLEELILQAVETETSSHSNSLYQHDPAKCKRLWLVPPAIAVGFLFAIGSDSLRTHSLFHSNWATTATPNDTELVSLEAFLEHNWNSVTLNNPSSLDFNSGDINWVQLTNSESKKLAKSVHQKTARR